MTGIGAGGVNANLPSVQEPTTGALQQWSAQTPATTESTHQMLVALAILSAVGMLLVIVAGISDDSADGVLLVVGALLLVQAITHVNPFVAWLANHPLTPAQAGIANQQ